jgi:hypothetical protein
MIHERLFQFKLGTTKENLTAHAGLALMAEFNHGLGIKDLVDKHLPKPMSNRGFKPSVFVESLVLMLEGGGRSLEDIRELKFEAGLMKLTGDVAIPSSDAVGDWLRRMGEELSGGLSGLDDVRRIVINRLCRRDGITDYTLDADATEIIGEKVDARFTYKGTWGRYPNPHRKMLGFLYETRLCIYDEFREGNTAPASAQNGFYKECKRRMPPGKRIARYRADSASYQAELINELENDSVKWAITARQDSSVKSLIRSIKEDQWYEPVKGCGYEITETVHSMNNTANAFRLVIKREKHKQASLFEKEPYFHHAIATNFLEGEKSAKEVLIWHNQRGESENFNKELKNGFGMEQMPCGTSSANAVFFRIGVIAYNLFVGFKRLSCPESWAKHTIGTLRWKMIQVAGYIVSHAGQIILKLSVGIKELAIFEEIRRKTFEFSLLCSG